MVARRRIERREDGVTRRRHGNSKPRSHELQEQATADAVPDGKLVKGSGCARLPKSKSDVVGDMWRAEDKTCEDPNAKSFRVQRGDLQKIATEAFHTQKVPLLVFGWPGNPREDWAAFRLKDAEAMMHAISALRRGDVNEAIRQAERL